MKSFFKKLSFVLALAMVITAMPVMNANAADAKKAAATFSEQNDKTNTRVSLITLKKGETYDVKFHGVSDYKTISYGYTSNATSVATVTNKSGVITAVADGLARITFKADGYEDAYLYVLVGESFADAKALTIKNQDGTAVADLEIEDTADYKFAGVSEWSKYSAAKRVAVFYSDNEAVLKCTDANAGKFVAVKADEATVTCVVSFDGQVAYVGSQKVTVKAAVVDEPVVDEPVVEEPTDYTFTAKQLNTNDVLLTFGADVDLTGLDASDFTVTAIDETFEYALFVNTVSVSDNTATINFVDGVLADKAVLTIAYKDAETTLIASNSEATKVKVSYGMSQLGGLMNVAYVSTDLDPMPVLLTYRLFDKNGVDVTKNYDTDDFVVDWDVDSNIANITEDVDYLAYHYYGDPSTYDAVYFDEKGTATVTLTLTTEDRDGNDKVLEDRVTITAKDWPAIAFTYNYAGIFNPASKDNSWAAINSFNNPFGTVWSTGYSTSLQVKTDSYFGAIVTDNRGRQIVTTSLDYSATGANYVGSNDAEYGDYGRFVYTSSNDSVVDIDEDGYLVAVGVGSATILTSFEVTDDETGRTTLTKIGAQRISVYAEPYAKTMQLTVNNITINSTGSAQKGSVYVQILDQNGNAMYCGSNIDSALELVAKNEVYENITWESKGVVWESATGWTPAYKYEFDGADFNALTKDGEPYISANKYQTFTFDVKFDKTVDDAFKNVTQVKDTAKIKVYNYDDYASALAASFTTEDTSLKYYFKNTGNKSYNVYQNKRTEFGNDSTSDYVKSITLTVVANAANGLKLQNIPTTNFVDLTDDSSFKVGTTNGSANKIYYVISTPKKTVDNVTIATSGVAGVRFTFNATQSNATAGTVEVLEATAGDYSVSWYVADSKGKLKLLSKDTITVSDNTPSVTFAGFYTTNKYDGNIPVDDISEVIDALEELCKFEFLGSLYEDLTIEDVEASWLNGKVRVSKIIFQVPEYVGPQNPSDHKYTWDVDYSTAVELKKNITIYFE